MALDRIMPHKKRVEILKNREDYQELLKLNDPIIALAMIATIGGRIELSSIEAQWVNHSGNTTESSLLIPATELALSKLPYQETMECILDLIDGEFITESKMGMIILKRIAADPDFFENLKKDNTIAPILFYYYPDVAKMMDPAIVKPSK